MVPLSLTESRLALLARLPLLRQDVAVLGSPLAALVKVAPATALVTGP
jgi:hypothetical protein